MTDPNTIADPADGGPSRWLGRGIGRRLLVYIVLFSILVTLVLAAVQLALAYRSDLQAIERRVAEVQRSRLDSIASSLWNVDAAQMRLQLDGIKSLPDIKAVTVRETESAAVDKPLVISVGEPDAGSKLHWDLPIVYSEFGKPRVIGVLRLEASRDAVLARLYNRALWILGSQAVETFLIALFFLLLVHYMVTRHLVTLARIVGRYDVRSPTAAFRLQRRSPPGGDELDRVVAALEGMRGNLELAYRDLSDTNAELERDIIARRRAEATAEHLANHDALTDLPNRRLLFERLKHELSMSARTTTHGSLLFIDVDHFKTLNDARGHAVGDAILVEVARRLAQNVRDIDLVARLGGDEFVAVLCGIDDSPDAAVSTALLVAEKLRAVIGMPIVIGEQAHHLTASIGVALFPADGNDMESLLKQADIAMFHAKSGGRNHVRFFQVDLHAALAARQEMEIELRAALAEGAFALDYQPLFAAGGHLRGAEALIRWNHPTRGVVSPAQFIPICEESGLIIGIGDWVLNEAARQLRQWNEAGLMRDQRYLTVNISPHQFRQPDFTSKLLSVCERNEVDPRQLVLEITEGVVLSDLGEAIETMHGLRKHGLRFFIDDFGTGYSSMAYLKLLPMDGLKIDQSFVADLKQDDNNAAIVEAILTIGHRFGLIVVAEGVENAEQVEFLRGLNCDVFQGYYFGRPVDAASFEHAYLRVDQSPNA